MTSSLRLVTLVVALLVLSVAPVGAQGQATEPAQAPESGRPWYKEITLNGLLAVSYVANVNHPPSGQNQFRIFDGEDDRFGLDVAEVVVQRAISKPGAAGFRVDLTAGEQVARAIASNGLFRGEDGETGEFDVHQAFFSYIAKVGTGLRVDAGKFVTLLGYEVIDGYDGINENASRSLLFGYAEPATHTGVRVGYTPNGVVNFQAVAVGGWDVAKDNNSGKSFGGQVALTPTTAFNAYFNYIGGPEQPDSGNMRHTISVVAVGKIGSRLALVGNLDAGREANVPLPDTAGGGTSDVTWTGFAGYVTVAAATRFDATVRAEWFDDPQGARTGYVQTLREVTFTPTLRFGTHLVLRGDVRHDWSNQAVFETHDGTPSRGQTTISANAAFRF